MKERARELRKDAEGHRDDGELERAGNLYTAAAHEMAGTVTEHLFPGPDRTNDAVGYLRYAATCYRVADLGKKSRNRCNIGELLVDDYIAFYERQEFERSFDRLRLGGWYENIGDLRVIAKEGRAGEAYDHAEELYERAGSCEFSMAEKEHMRLSGFFRNVRRGVDDEIPEDALENRPFGPSFLDWLDYKRERLPDLLDELEARGEWPAVERDK